MKNNMKLTYGILTAVFIHVLAIILGKTVKLDIEWLPYNFITHTTILVFSVVGIKLLNKNIDLKISLPGFKLIFRPFFVGLFITILTNVIFSIGVKLLGYEFDKNPAFSLMSNIQIFLFIFIYASISEEMLYRGFLLNFIKPLILGSVTIFRRKISYVIIISAVIFGLSHLVLLLSDVSQIFILRTVIFTTILGIVAGYYQEKYNNTSYAIIVHMGGNSMALVAMMLMEMKPVG